jgi:hypothetical protein
MKVLGVLFDSKLNWQSHLQLAITKSKKALQAIKMIKNYFTKGELLTLLISNYYSILYYNAEIWLIPSLTHQAKTHLYSASANPLKMCYPFYDNSISFERLHSITKRPPPDSIIKFKHALLLHKIYNSTEPNKDWTDIFFNQHFNERSNTVNLFDTSKFKQGKNLLCNRFVCINKKITYDSLNLPYSKFKTHAKRIFLT